MGTGEVTGIEFAKSRITRHRIGKDHFTGIAVGTLHSNERWMRPTVVAFKFNIGTYTNWTSA
jgi:hypothetical protein